MGIARFIMEFLHVVKCLAHRRNPGAREYETEDAEECDEDSQHDGDHPRKRVGEKTRPEGGGSRIRVSGRHVRSSCVSGSFAFIYLPETEMPVRGEIIFTTPTEGNLRSSTRS
jgi:hypothetical protein